MPTPMLLSATLYLYIHLLGISHNDMLDMLHVLTIDETAY